MDRKGISHIEVILATLMFVGFIVFAFYFFTPMSSNKIADSSGDYLIRELDNNIATEVLKYSVIIQGSENVMTVSISSITEKTEARVEDANENVLGSKIDKSGRTVYFNRNSQDYATIYLSDDLPAKDDLSSGESGTDYVLGTSSANNLLSISKLKAAIEDYNSDYKDFRSSLNIPSQTDFSFYFQYSNGSRIITNKNVPDNVNVYSGEKYYEVLNEDGSRGFGRIVVLTW